MLDVASGAGAAGGSVVVGCVDTVGRVVEDDGPADAAVVDVVARTAEAEVGVEVGVEVVESTIGVAVTASEATVVEVVDDAVGT